jgi:HD-GYP domain-containing protein (c-di-GMP phosphodiesterase class II)
VALNPDRAEQERIAAAAAQRRVAPPRREQAVEAGFALAFVLTALAVWLVAGAGAQGDAVPALLCMLCLAVAVNVPFAVGDGYTVPTQLAFVPLAFALSPGLLAPAVVVALVAARIPAVVAGRVPANRLLLIPGDAWFALGPAAVLAAAHWQPFGQATAWLLLAALAAQVLTEIIVWAARERLIGGAGLQEQLRELWIHGVDLALTPVGLLAGLAQERHEYAALALLPLLGVLAVFSRERRARMESLTELNQAYRGTALVLGDVVEADDAYTGVHSRGVVALTTAVGEALGLSADRLRNLEFAALLHDVGKVSIPKEIINKPGRLDPEEWAIVKTHTIAGQRILDRVGGFMSEVGTIVRSHHERWDGSGYPDGLAGEAIPLEARIITCCDSWNAMRTDRSYRLALSVPEAVAEMQRCAGTQFDPRIVETLLARVAVHELPAQPARTPLIEPVPA